MLLECFAHMIVEDRDDEVMGGGCVRIYRLPNGYGLNAINTPLAHRFPYAWEFAVLEPDATHPSGFGDVVFDTPLTGTVAVCKTEAEAASFLERAVAWAMAVGRRITLGNIASAQRTMIAVLSSKIRSILATGWTICTLLLGLSQVSQAGDASPQVDVALVLAIDASASVDAREMQLQIGGTTQALMDDEVVEALLSGPAGGSALAYVIWGGADLPRQVSAWHVIRTKADVLAFSAALSSNARLIAGFTGIAAAIEEAMQLLDALPVTSGRKVIDVSGDGRESNSRERKSALSKPIIRANVQQSDVTINGLAITGNDPELADWYRANVSSGPDHFVIAVEHFEDFAEAMRSKLLRELAPSEVAFDETSSSAELNVALIPRGPPDLIPFDIHTTSTSN